MEMTPGQRKQLKSLAIEAISPFVEKIDLTHKEAQELITHGGKIKILQQAFLRAARIRYKDQEVKPKLGYPPGWRGFKSIEEQLNILIHAVPGLKPDSLLERWQILHPIPHDLPTGAEGWCVFPKPHRLGKTYFHAFVKALRLLSARFPDTAEDLNRILERNDSCILEKFTRSFLFHATMNYQTTRHNSDFFIVAAQFGINHADQSPFRVRETLLEREYGKDGWVEAALGPYEGAIMLLTHPERLQSENDLRISFPGATLYPENSSSIPCAPEFGIFGNVHKDMRTKAGVSFSADYLWSHGYGRRGAATAFLWEDKEAEYE